MLVVQFENLKNDKIENFLSQQKLQDINGLKSGNKSTINNTLANINPNYSRISNEDNLIENDDVNESQSGMTDISEKSEKDSRIMIEDDDQDSIRDQTNCPEHTESLNKISNHEKIVYKPEDRIKDNEKNSKGIQERDINPFSIEKLEMSTTESKLEGNFIKLFKAFDIIYEHILKLIEIN